jgi:hypothetical protein
MTVIRGRRIISVGLWLVVASVAGCLRVLSIDYQATNSIRGQGTVHVASVQYQPADEQRVRPHEVETPEKSEARLFLSETVATAFSRAVQAELARSGYTLMQSASRTISGVVTRFYLDWRKEGERTFELEVTYVVQSDAHRPFSWSCSSVKTGRDMLQEDALLMKAGMTDCIQRFLLVAQEAQML